MLLNAKASNERVLVYETEALGPRPGAIIAFPTPVGEPPVDAEKFARVAHTFIDGIDHNIAEMKRQQQPECDVELYRDSQVRTATSIVDGVAAVVAESAAALEADEASFYAPPAPTPDDAAILARIPPLTDARAVNDMFDSFLKPGADLRALNALANDPLAAVNPLAQRARDIVRMLNERAKPDAARIRLAVKKRVDQGKRPLRIVACMYEMTEAQIQRAERRMGSGSGGMTLQEKHDKTNLAFLREFDVLE